MRFGKDITGQRFGHLIAIKKIAKRPNRWLFRCDCGNTAVTRLSKAVYGTTVSCGCRRIEVIRAYNAAQSHTFHGMSKTTEYRTYAGAKGRCQNPDNKAYHNYGGRGIEFRFKSFAEFFAELGYKPSPELTIDRIDNDGHYESGNVRWATRAQQRKNCRRPRKGLKRNRRKKL
jgi:hypothetical protein